MMNELIAFDTNTLIYCFDNTEKEKYQIGLNLFDKIIAQEIRVLLSIQNINEFYQWAVKRKKIDKNYAEMIIHKLSTLSNVVITPLTLQTTLFAIKIQKQHNKSLGDSLIVANAFLNNANIVYTENEKDFSKDLITIVNPFKV